MSAAPDNELDLDKLFLPAWAQAPASARQYAQYEGGEESERPGRREGRPNRGQPRRDGAGRGRRDEPRSRDDRHGPSRPMERREGPAGRERFARPGERRERREDRPPPQPLPELNVSFIPDEKGVESLSRQVRMTGRAYPLFDIAQMILQRPERHGVALSVKKDAEGRPLQPLYVC